MHFALVVHKKMARSRLVLRLLLRTAYQAFTNPFILPTFLRPLVLLGDNGRAKHVTCPLCYGRGRLFFSVS